MLNNANIDDGMGIFENVDRHFGAGSARLAQANAAQTDLAVCVDGLGDCKLDEKHNDVGCWHCRR